MKLGFVSAILPESNLQEVLATGARLGYETVELMCWPVGKADRRYAGVTHVDVNALHDKTVDEILGASSEANVSISGLGYYPNPLTPDPSEAEAAIAQLYKVIDGAAALGVHQMNSFVGRDWTRSIDDNWANFERTWRPIVEYAEGLGVNIGIENCPMFFSNDEWPGGKNLATTPRIWERMFESIPNSNFGLNYDPSHMIWQHMDYLAPMRDFSSRIFHVHAKDVRVDQHLLDQVGILANPAEYHTPKLPGMGDVDWGRFFSVLTDVGYQGPVCVEVEDRAYEHSLDARIQSLQQSHQYLRNFIPHSM